MAVPMVASAASITTRLVSKLSIRNKEEPMDMGNLRCLEKGFVTPMFYLVRKFNTTRAVTFDSFRSVVRLMWCLSTPVEVQERCDRYLFTFINERDVIQVKKVGPWGYQRAMILLNDYAGWGDD
ncbi:hypothetical protein ACLB2K_049463 [Fragaria x ananassa]